jgi:hypothetical protein
MCTFFFQCLFDLWNQIHLLNVFLFLVFDFVLGMFLNHKAEVLFLSSLWRHMTDEWWLIALLHGNMIHKHKGSFCIEIDKQWCLCFLACLVIHVRVLPALLSCFRQLVEPRLWSQYKAIAQDKSKGLKVSFSYSLYSQVDQDSFLMAALDFQRFTVLMW